MICTATALALICTSEPASADSDDLSGTYLVLGPVGGATHLNGGWDSTFGLELGAIRIREPGALRAFGVTFGGHDFSEIDGGRLWSDALVGLAGPYGTMLGLTAGIAIEVDDVRPPRFGAQGTLWIFAGIVPYLRIGRVERSGTFVDLGIKVALPAISF